MLFPSNTRARGLLPTVKTITRHEPRPVHHVRDLLPHDPLLQYDRSQKAIQNKNKRLLNCGVFGIVDEPGSLWRPTSSVAAIFARSRMSVPRLPFIKPDWNVTSTSTRKEASRTTAPSVPNMYGFFFPLLLYLDKRGGRGTLLRPEYRAK